MEKQNKPTSETPVKVIIVQSNDELKALEDNLLRINRFELMPYARECSYTELITNIPDRGYSWQHPLAIISSKHSTVNGTKSICKKMHEFLNSNQGECPCDILSISAYMDDDSIILRTIIRYYKNVPPMEQFYSSLNEVAVKEVQTVPQTGRLIIPDEVKNVTYTDYEVQEHKRLYNEQCKMFDSCSEDMPFLNSIDTYVRRELYNPEDNIPLIYDLKTKDSSIQTISSYDNFIYTFNEIMTNHITGTEYNDYINVIRDKDSDSQKIFMENVEYYIKKEYVNGPSKFPIEDVPYLLKKIERALFQLYIVQDLIDDVNITDVKITDYDAIRVRIGGKAYLSNINFVDRTDYSRFVQSVLIKNNIPANTKEQSFTYDFDENYILRFSYIPPRLTGNKMPNMHIRKVARKKLLGDDLIKKGVMDEKIRDYLLDCGKYSRGVVFAGPPGSGKTVALNWFLEEAYEQSAEILVIQENDELFAYRKGIIFQHVINNPEKGQDPVTLEDLGQQALVAGANVFVIGEAKGAEICSAITLSNSGCRTAITIHSQSATETIDKMADLAMRGYAHSIEQAKRMIKSFETIVYMQDFKVQEITRIIGYDEEKKDMIYQHIYKRH